MESQISPEKKAYQFGLSFSLVISLVLAIYEMYLISISTSSMAIPGAIAQIIFVAVPSFFTGWALAYLYQWLKNKSQCKIPLLVCAVLILLYMGKTVIGIAYSQHLSEIATKTSSREELLSISQSSLATVRSPICWAITANANLDLSLALEMRKVSKCHVAPIIASNPDTPSEILIELSQIDACGTDVQGSLLRNKKLPIEAKTNIQNRCGQVIEENN